MSKKQRNNNEGYMATFWYIADISWDISDINWGDLPDLNWDMSDINWGDIPIKKQSMRTTD